MYYIVYKTTNLINGKYYVGVHKTSNIEDGYLGSGTALSNAINKYGRDNFSKIILYIYDNRTDMLIKEAEIVNEEFCNSENTYNIMPGGGSGFHYINKRKLNNNNRTSESYAINRGRTGKYQGKMLDFHVSQWKSLLTIEEKKLLHKQATLAGMDRIAITKGYSSHSEYMRHHNPKFR